MDERRKGQDGQSKETPKDLNLWKLLLRNSLLMTNFAMPFARKLVFLLKRSIESGRMPRETSRSESRVE
jgi:hypothetical protein